MSRHELGFKQEADGTLLGLSEESLVGAVCLCTSRVEESQQGDVRAEATTMRAVATTACSTEVRHLSREAVGAAA